MTALNPRAYDAGLGVYFRIIIIGCEYQRISISQVCLEAKAQVLTGGSPSSVTSENKE